MIPKAVFLVGLAIAASGLVSPPVALALGLAFGFAFPHPFDQSAKKLSRYLLQASVVGLGFGMNLHDVIRAGRSGFRLHRPGHQLHHAGRHGPGRAAQDANVPRLS